LEFRAISEGADEIIEEDNQKINIHLSKKLLEKTVAFDNRWRNFTPFIRFIM
jgi:hypothetical protein|tara:strand:+ start:205 stop:360 length:156 start_codon:yes stop_codon:yes gene_type:complete